MAARTFSTQLKEGNLNDLIFAPLITDEEAAASPAVEHVDDPDQNKEPEEADH